MRKTQRWSAASMRGANLWRRNQGESIQDILTIYNPFGLTTPNSGDFSGQAVTGGQGIGLAR
jgi:hypothetical protein